MPKRKKPTPAERVVHLNKLNTLNTAPVKELVNLSPYVFLHGTAKLLEEVYVKVWVEGTEKDAGEYLRNQYGGVLAYVRAGGGMAHTLAENTEDKVQRAIENAAYRIGMAWRKQAKRK